MLLLSAAMYSMSVMPYSPPPNTCRGPSQATPEQRSYPPPTPPCRGASCHTPPRWGHSSPFCCHTWLAASAWWLIGAWRNHRTVPHHPTLSPAGKLSTTELDEVVVVEVEELVDKVVVVIHRRLVDRGGIPPLVVVALPQQWEVGRMKMRHLANKN